MNTNKPKPNSVTPKYEPTAQERSALDKFDCRRVDQIAPGLKVRKSGDTAAISVDHPNQPVGWSLLMEALGTADTDFAKGLLHQLTNAGLKDDKIDEASVNFLLSVVKNVKANDHLVAMLAAQMAVVHTNTMTFGQRLLLADTLQDRECAERAFNKLARTFAIQLETLQRFLSGGEPQVTVQNLSVNKGGQAIVGNINRAPSVTECDKFASSPPAVTEARMAPMPTIDNQEHPPVAVQHRQKDDKGSST